MSCTPGSSGKSSLTRGSSRQLSPHTATGTVSGEVPVGERPWGVAISPDGRQLYTANGPSNDITIVDVASWTVVAKVPVGERPWGVVVIP